MAIDTGTSPPTVLTVDLGAIASNYRLLRERLRGVECAGVVKANGYGLGAVPVAQALWAAGCRRFFVAHAEEGLELRQGLTEGEIFVLNGPLPGEAAAYRHHRLIPVLNSLEQIAAWREAASTAGTDLPAIIHIDTGMSRLGLSEAEVDRLAAEPGRLQGIALRYVMSHLAVAEEPDHPLNARQIERFLTLKARLPTTKASFANSSGVFLDPSYHFDLARPGAALYGINPHASGANPMAQVVQLQARILQVRGIDRGETVGYGAAFRASGPVRVATVAIGYADGFLRTLGNRGCAFLDGNALPIIGRVSMDLVTLDATAAPTATVGRMVELIGPSRPVDVVAAEAGTIGYEMLTRLGRRFRRDYLAQAG